MAPDLDRSSRVPLFLAALEFLFNGNTDEISAILGLGQNCLDALEGALGKAGLHILGPKFFSSHRIFSHMRY